MNDLKVSEGDSWAFRVTVMCCLCYDDAVADIVTSPASSFKQDDHISLLMMLMMTMTMNALRSRLQRHDCSYFQLCQPPETLYPGLHM